MASWRFALTFAAALGASTVTATATAQSRNPFAQGRLRLGLGLGSAGSFDSRYIVGGAHLGVFVLDGLEVGVGGDVWLGGTPAIGTLSPEVRYILFFDPVSPYVGVFYRHWFIGGGYADQDNLGARAGIVWLLGEHLYLALGGAYEITVSSCDGECEAYYPELALSIVF